MLFAATALTAGEDQAGDLRLRLPPGSTWRYAWSIDSANDSRGTEKGKPFNLRVDKSVRMTVVLHGRPAKKPGLIATAMRFENLSLEENRQVGRAARSTLKVNRQRIWQTERGRVVIDSRNDIGLEKITDYQRHLRGLERREVRLNFNRAGKQSRVAGDPLLVETLHAGTAPGLFPILAGKKAKPGAVWSDRFDLPTLGELKLDAPASVIARMKFAKWVKRPGRKLALLEIVSAWENAELRGKDAHGLSVAITELEGLGTGVCYFDPQAGRYEEGSITLQLRYRIRGRKKNARTELAVKGKTHFRFKWMEAGSVGPAPPPPNP